MRVERQTATLWRHQDSRTVRIRDGYRRGDIARIVHYDPLTSYYRVRFPDGDTAIYRRTELRNG